MIAIKTLRCLINSEIITYHIHKSLLIIIYIHKVMCILWELIFKIKVEHIYTVYTSLSKYLKSKVHILIT